MTFYITPYGRLRRQVARRAPESRYSEENWNEPEYEVLVPINVKAEQDAFVITALLPGVKADEVSIQVVDDTVTLQGEIKSEEEKDEPYLARECPTGRFYRVVRLPEALDTSAAEADLSDGVLTLRVPKAEEARPRSIKVNKGNNK